MRRISVIIACKSIKCFKGIRQTADDINGGSMSAQTEGARSYHRSAKFREEGESSIYETPPVAIDLLQPSQPAI
jgi:hypothetical protein